MKSSSRHTGFTTLFVILCALYAPGLLAQDQVAQDQVAQDQAATELPASISKQPLKESRLWLPPAQANHREALVRAARQALLHQNCSEVLYGGLNEFRSEREGTSFTILCMRDGRSTFNQVFFESELMTDEDISARTASGAAELERLRSLMQQPGAQPVQPPTTPEQSEIRIDAGSAPVLF
jgi:hypothetical protein